MNKILDMHKLYTQELIDELRDRMASILPDERKVIFEKVMDGYCPVCGEFEETRKCYCRKDV
jgi:hypothetical protein